jgi:hypothetical protein
MAKASATITLFHVVDIKETHRYYLLQSSTATAPSKPTAYPPGGSWVTTEPSYTEGSTNSLYLVDCTVYNDDSFDYTPVSKSSSYEAAKAAYNKAVNAQNSANNANNKIDNLGGTNLLRGTNSVEAITSSSPWSKGHWRAGGTGTGTRSIIAITDAPNPNIKQGFKIVGNNDDSNVAQNDIPVVNGQQYTISCYARGTGLVRLQAGDSPYSAKDTTLNSATAWVRLSHTFVIGTSCGASNNNTNVYFANRGTGTVEFCGLKMETGQVATDWSPSPYDVDDRAPKYAESSTAAATAAKVATVTAGSGNIKAGDSVTVKFTNANTALNPTLNINSMGAKPIVTNGVKYAYWVAGQSVLFTYDGTNWQVASTPVYANTATIGNPSTGNVYIDADSVDVRYGSKTLSQFTEDAIYLGKNSRSATIDLCNGVAQMYNEPDTVNDYNRLITYAEDEIRNESRNFKIATTHSDGTFTGETYFYMSSFTPWLTNASVLANVELRTSCYDESTLEYIGESYLGMCGKGDANISLSAKLGEASADLDIDGRTGQVKITGSPAEYILSVTGKTLLIGDVKIRGKVDTSDDVRIPNAKSIRSYDTDGNVTTLLHMNASNNILLGYGGYAAGIGATVVYGNEISLNSKGTMYFKRDGTSAMVLTYITDDERYCVRPYTDMGAILGSTNNRWYSVNANILRTYNTSTTSNGVNARVYENRIYRYSSSSRRYKDNIESISDKEIDPYKLYDAEVVQFKYKDGYLIDKDSRCDKLVPGFIVEDLEKIYPIAIDYNDDGNPEMWNANIMIPSMLKLIQDLKKEIDLLKDTKGE